MSFADLTLDVTINKGRLTPVEYDLRNPKNLSCSVGSQSPASVSWTNPHSIAWTKSVELSVSRIAHLQVVQKNVLLLKPRSSDIINALNCSVNVNIISCNTVFFCNANYVFNKTIAASSSIDVNFLLGTCCTYLSTF